MEIEKLQRSLHCAWSRETCFPTDQKKWTSENPGLGQCGVTSLAVWFFCGGDILEKKHKTGRAFYNRLPNGDIVDLSGQECDKIDAPERVRNPKDLLRGHTQERLILLLSQFS